MRSERTVNEYENSEPGRKVWFHGASVGDLKSISSVLAPLSREVCLSPVLTYWSREAQLFAKSELSHWRARRAPLPLAPFSASFLNAEAPELCVFEYLELYPSWIKHAKKRGIPVAIINGRVTQKSIRIKPLLASWAQQIDLFAAQTELDAENASMIGVRQEAIRVMGSSKRDALLYTAPPSSSTLESCLGRFEVVVGSLHPDEEAGLVDGLSALNGRILIAPRYMSQVSRLEKRLKRAGYPFRRRSRALVDTANEKIVILDSIGELHAAYGLAPNAIVGGTFGQRGGQNLLEPATMGATVFFGPHTSRIREEVVSLIGCGGVEIQSFEDAFRQLSYTGNSSSTEELTRAFPPCVPQLVSALSDLLCTRSTPLQQ